MRKNYFVNIIFNMLRFSHLIIALPLMLFIQGCRDVFEKDISAERVVLLTPADQVTVLSLGLVFRWEPVEEALMYRLQLASPNFSTTGSYELDTLLSATQFAYTVSPSQGYQWRVKAMNGTSETP